MAESVRTLWARYRGIADEYETLKGRWQFLQKDFLLNDLKETFVVLDQERDRIYRLFESYFGINEKKSEQEYDRRKLVSADTIGYLTLYRKIWKFYNYISTIRKCFLDRTVSRQIPYATTHLPHSVERTIANERFYMAADRIMKDYISHARLQTLKWDGIISFVPPITHFHGGTYSSPLGNMFHISLSEETKFFIGHYLTLAHELGHAIIVDSEIGESWKRFVLNRANEIERRCPLRLKCIVLKDSNGSGEQITGDILTEIMADIIALKISGLNSIREFLDYSAMSYPLHVSFGSRNDRIEIDVRQNFEITRILACLTYVLTSERYKNCWPDTISILRGVQMEVIRNLQEVTGLGTKLLRGRPTEKLELLRYGDEYEQINTLYATTCAKCMLYELGGILGIYMRDFEDQKGSPSFGDVIRREFTVRKSEEKRIENCLLSGIVMSNIAPCKILNAYYSLYARGGRPHYGVAIESILRSGTADKWHY